MRVVDLFCGCGGLSLGFEKAGMEVVAGFDNWQDALTVYRNNFSHPAFRADLMDVEGSVEKIRPFAPDMIIGGPPCQDFSSAGKRDENNGRGDLTVCYARIIASIRPQWFVMENVERITKTQKLQDALAIFHEAGYGTSYTVLNAALCGVPQRRKRFVMIGRLGAENCNSGESCRSRNERCRIFWQQAGHKVLLSSSTQLCSSWHFQHGRTKCNHSWRKPSYAQRLQSTPRRSSKLFGRSASSYDSCT